MGDVARGRARFRDDVVVGGTDVDLIGADDGDTAQADDDVIGYVRVQLG